MNKHNVKVASSSGSPRLTEIQITEYLKHVKHISLDVMAFHNPAS